MSGLTFSLWQVEPASPGADLRSVRLSGWAAPIDELRIGGSQRAQLAWMPAADRASVRLDGPEEDEIELSFDWKSRLIVGGDDAVVTTIGPSGKAASTDGIDRIETLVNTMHTLRRERALLQLAFGDEEHLGYIARFEAVLRRAGEYVCELYFQPIVAPNIASARPRAAFDPDRTAQDLTSLFESGVTDAREAQLPTFREREVSLTDAAIEEVRGALSDVRVQARTIDNVGREIRAVQEGVAFALGGVLTAGVAVLDAIRAPGEQIAQTDEYAAQLRARAYRTRIRQTTAILRRRASEERRGLSTGGPALGRHEVSQGETLWSISWRWYGTTRHAELIAARNGLSSPFVDAGVVLVIPRRPGDA